MGFTASHSENPFKADRPACRRQAHSGLVLEGFSQKE